jgi:hypothetical protein
MIARTKHTSLFGRKKSLCLQTFCKNGVDFQIQVMTCLVWRKKNQDSSPNPAKGASSLGKETFNDKLKRIDKMFIGIACLFYFG